MPPKKSLLFLYRTNDFRARCAASSELRPPRTPTRACPDCDRPSRIRPCPGARHPSAGDSLSSRLPRRARRSQRRRCACVQNRERIASNLVGFFTLTLSYVLAERARETDRAELARRQHEQLHVSPLEKGKRHCSARAISRGAFQTLSDTFRLISFRSDYLRRMQPIAPALFRARRANGDGGKHSARAFQNTTAIFSSLHPFAQPLL